MAVNRYPATCSVCRGRVPALGGILTGLKLGGNRWEVRHLACKAGESEVISVRFSSGDTITINKNGRCIDAPCCGCCS